MKLAKDILTLGKALGTRLSTLLTGGVVMAAAFIGQGIYKFEWTPERTLGITAIFLVLSVFNVWRTERAERDEVQSRLLEAEGRLLEKRRLVLEMDGRLTETERLLHEKERLLIEKSAKLSEAEIHAGIRRLKDVGGLLLNEMPQVWNKPDFRERLDHWFVEVEQFCKAQLGDRLPLYRLVMDEQNLKRVSASEHFPPKWLWSGEAVTDDVPQLMAFNEVRVKCMVMTFGLGHAEEVLERSK